MTLLPPFGDVLSVRADVLDPRSMLDMIDLGIVSAGRRRGLAHRGPGIETLQDPKAFFDITYPTAEIVDTLKTLSRRVSDPESVPGTILLSGRYGHGKSHVLLVAHHALNAPDVAAAWARKWNLGSLDFPENPIVITRSFIQHADEPLWDMLLSNLSPTRKPKVGDFPDGERIGSLLGERRVFLIMDELERWYDAQDERDKSRNRNFLQALTEVSMRDDRLTVLTSVLGEKEEPAETIRRVRPLELSFRSAEDRQRVALFRLFANRDDPSVDLAASSVADAYVETYRAAGIRNIDGLRARMIACWPFTPEFLDILTKKVPNLGGFQNTRGTLRFLAHVVRHTYQRRPVVSSQDLPLNDDAIHQALSNLDTTGGEVIRRALGDNYEAVSENLPHRDELFSALAFYSIADPTHPGATLDEILLATLDPGENAIRIRDSLAQLKQRAFNLHERDERFVFLAVENPHARINAMAASQIVTRDAAKGHVLSALEACWNGKERTTVFTAPDWSSLQEGLRGLRNARPRIVLCTTVLSAEERLRVQNADERRNLVLIVEPSVRTSTGESRYNLLTNDALLQRGRRIEACKLLLEGRPVAATADVYRQVQQDETNRLRKAVVEQYGVAISWHRAGATGTEVDDSWYELCRLDTPTADALLAMWRSDLTGLPDIVVEIRNRWQEFRTRSVRELEAWFETTPGLPVPMESGWIAEAVKQLANEKILSLVQEDGSRLTAASLKTISDDALRACTLADPSVEPTAPPPPRPPLVHPRVSAQWDAGRKGVLVAWAFPPVPAEGGSFATLVQRYTSARNWEIGRNYPVDTGETHEANRYQGNEEAFLDTERLQQGEWYHYYVFLVYFDPAGDTTFTLSQRCDVGVPRVDPSLPGVLETSIHADVNKLVAEVERMVMSGQHMTSDSRVRKLELRIGGVRAPAVRSELAGGLSQAVGESLEATADLTFVTRGEYDRQAVLRLLRQAPRYEGASYAATLHLKTDASQETTR